MGSRGAKLIRIGILPKSAGAAMIKWMILERRWSVPTVNTGVRGRSRSAMVLRCAWSSLVFLEKRYNPNSVLELQRSCLLY